MSIAVTNRIYPLRYPQNTVSFTSGNKSSQRVPSGVESSVKAVPVAVLIAAMTPNISVANNEHLMEPKVVVTENADVDEFPSNTLVLDEDALSSLVSVGNSESGDDKNMKIPVPKEYKYNANDMYQFPFNPAFKVIGKVEFNKHGVELYYLSSDNNDDNAEHLALVIPSEQFGEQKGSYYVKDLVKITGDWADCNLNLLGDWIKVQISPEDGVTSVLTSGQSTFRVDKELALQILNATCQDRANSLPYAVFGLGDRLCYSGD